MVVSTLSGTLVHAGFNARTAKMEVRSFAVSGQDGPTVRGLYRTTGAPDRAFAGTLSAARALRITLPGTNEAAEGTLPDRISDDGAIWPLTMRGDSVDGVRLDFRRAAGGPAGPAPDAVAEVTFGSLGNQMGLVNLTPVTFDGTKSRGEALSYFFELGDGQNGTSSQLTRPVRRAGLVTARLTVVDKFGQSDSNRGLTG